jgi:hypothetical protein
VKGIVINVCKTGCLKFEICFHFGDEAFLKKREVAVGQAMYRQVSFYGRVTFLKNITRVEHKIPVQNGFPGGWGFVSLILCSI